jgi:hypothetical protein
LKYEYYLYIFFALKFHVPIPRQFQQGRQRIRGP